MKRIKSITLILALVLSLALGSVTAFAKENNESNQGQRRGQSQAQEQNIRGQGQSQGQGQKQGQSMQGHGSQSVALVAELTGRSIEDLLQERRETGKTLSEIANEAGVGEQFKASFLATKKARIQQLVEAGRLTQELADERIALMEQNFANCDGTGIGKNQGGESGMGLGLGRNNGSGKGLRDGRGIGNGNQGNGLRLRDGSGIGNQGNSLCDGSCLD
ncbi:MAG: hypothetical protein GX217_04130 [Clostridiaceae bacterium]|nr:hypothetical protein [Clostridiaceae bacterium]